MVICTVEVNEKAPQTIVIGRRGTYNTQEIVFDIGYLIDAYGAGTAVLAIKRSQDSSAYPTVVTQEDTTLTWTVSETDTYYVGAGECQLMWYVDGGLAKTIIYPLVVMRDILSTSEEAPDAYQTWVDDLTALGAETLQNARDAAQSATDAETAQGGAEDAQLHAETAQREAEAAADRAEEAITHQPIITNGYWWVWNEAAQAYQDTGVKAEGRDGTDGFSPTITVVDITGGHRVTITDVNETRTVDVMNGTNGDDGYSPVVTITEITGGHRVTITDETHPTGQSFDVMDGQDGASDAGEVTYDETATYPSGSVGAELSHQKNAINQKAPLIINTASGDVANFVDGADGMQIRKIVGAIVTPEGGTGKTSATIRRFGNNLCDFSTFENGYLKTDGSWVTTHTQGEMRSGWIPVKPNTRYRFQVVKYTTFSNWTALCEYRTQSASTFISPRQVNESNYIEVTTSPNTHFVKVSSRYLSTASAVWFGLASEYKALTVSWSTEAGTINNGSVTLNGDGSVDVINSETSDVYHYDNIGDFYTCYGDNIISVSTGAITECDYPADTKLYVDGLTAPDEDMIANANIASGKYFVVNNQLYLSTAAIAAGASIVPGTNCTATNLAEALNALNT